MVNPDILLDLIQKYGHLREMQGSWHTLGQCGYDPNKEEAKKERQADELYSKIESYIRSGRFDQLFP